MNDSHFSGFIHILLESGDEDMQLFINLDSMKLPSRSTRRLLPLFHQGSSSAGSEPEPSFKPVLCFSTPKAPAPNQEKRFVSSTKTLLG